MEIIITQDSLNLVNQLSKTVKTFHHHYHILFDIAQTFDKDKTINYVEIGSYAGGSACLMIQRPNTNVIAIDWGHPIGENIVRDNIKKFNVNKNSFNYLRGTSQDINIKNRLKSLVIDRIHILFIDGGHKREEVISDFNLYNDLVRIGGYIVFDDYNDKEHCPEVKLGVDEIISNLGDNYEIIGTFKNTLKAYPDYLEDGNCFVIRKIK